MSTLAFNSVVGPMIQNFSVVNCVFHKLVIAHVGYVHILYTVGGLPPSSSSWDNTDSHRVLVSHEFCYGFARFKALTFDA